MRLSQWGGVNGAARHEVRGLGSSRSSGREAGLGCPLPPPPAAPSAGSRPIPLPGRVSGQDPSGPSVTNPSTMAPSAVRREQHGLLL